MGLEQTVKELALVGFVTAFMAAAAYGLFYYHHLLYEYPYNLVACVYIWFSLMYILYIRKLVKWVVKKEMGIQKEYEEELKGG